MEPKDYKSNKHATIYTFKIGFSRKLGNIVSTMSQDFMGVNSCDAKEKAKDSLPLWEIVSCVCIG